MPLVPNSKADSTKPVPNALKANLSKLSSGFSSTNSLNLLPALLAPKAIMPHILLQLKL